MRLDSNPTLLEIDHKQVKSDSHNTKTSNTYWEKPTNNRQRLTLLKELRKAISLDPIERLHAVQIAGLWGDAAALPIIRIGLKDSDSRVMCAAARAMEKHRGKTTSVNQVRLSPPRNIALTL